MPLQQEESRHPMKQHDKSSLDLGGRGALVHYSLFAMAESAGGEIREATLLNGCFGIGWAVGSKEIYSYLDVNLYDLENAVLYRAPECGTNSASTVVGVMYKHYTCSTTKPRLCVLVPVIFPQRADQSLHQLGMGPCTIHS